MRISLKQLINLPVETELKQSLGKIIDLNLDIDNQAIAEYVVQSGLIKKQNFLIKPTQVIKITEEKMVVSDAVLKIKDEAISRASLGANVLANVSQIVK